MKRGEPSWTDEDRAYAMALQDFEDNACDGCGQQLTDSLSDDWVWELDEPSVCYACQAVATGVEDYADDNRHKALKHRVIKRPRH